MDIVDSQYYVLQLCLNSVSNDPLPTPKCGTVSAVLSNLSKLIGLHEFQFSNWAFPSHISNGIALCFPVTGKEATKALANSSSVDITKVIEQLGYKADSVEGGFEITGFMPSIRAVSISSSGTNGVTYQIGRFCLGPAEEAPQSPQDVPEHEYLDIIESDLRTQAGLLQSHNPALNRGNLCIGNLKVSAESHLHEHASVTYRVCDISFTANIDIVGPFRFGHETGDYELGRIETKQVGQYRNLDGIIYNKAAFIELLAFRTGGLSRPYTDFQNSFGVFSTEAENLQTLELLAEEISQYILNVNEHLEPINQNVIAIAAKENPPALAVKIHTSDNSLLAEFRHTLNEIRLDNPALARSTNSFPNALIVND